jgi:hypothetical protein
VCAFAQRAARSSATLCFQAQRKRALAAGERLESYVCMRPIRVLKCRAFAAALGEAGRSAQHVARASGPHRMINGRMPLASVRAVLAHHPAPRRATLSCSSVGRGISVSCRRVRRYSRPAAMSS